MTELAQPEAGRPPVRAPEPAAAPAPAETAAALVVRLRRDAGFVAADMEAPPRPPIARMAAGRSPGEAARLSGLVFNVCAAAQEGAARAAFGLRQPPDAGRRIAVDCLRDHAMRLAVSWPRALGLAPEPEALRRIPHGPADDGAALARALFGGEGPPRRLADLEAWLDAGETAAARAVAHVWRRWDSRWARAALPLWRPGAPFVDIDWVAAEIDGRAVDISAAARVAEEDLMREVEARRGRGLAWRMIARVVDAARLLDALPEGAPGETPRALAPGLGVASASRGAMLVKGAAVEGRVVAFARLSPTDCALHPHGLLAHALGNLPRRRRAPLAQVAALTLETIDPCLPHRLDLEDFADV